MNRRNFMRSLIGGVAATAAVRAWPFRVYSFPSQPVSPELIQYGAGIKLDMGFNLFDYAGIPIVKMPSSFILLGGRNLAYDGPVYE